MKHEALSLTLTLSQGERERKGSLVLVPLLWERVAGSRVRGMLTVNCSLLRDLP